MVRITHIRGPPSVAVAAHHVVEDALISAFSATRHEVAFGEQANAVAADKQNLLLGREGFFDVFDVAFDNRHKKVVLTRLF